MGTSSWQTNNTEGSTYAFRVLQLFLRAFCGRIWLFVVSAVVSYLHGFLRIGVENQA